MIIPGTTVAISLLPGYVEVRDKGRVEKKIKIRNRSFADVEAELQEYFRIKGKRLPPGVIREALIRIGVPEVRVIITDEELEASTERTSTTSIPITKTQRTDLAVSDTQEEPHIAARTEGVSEQRPVSDQTAQPRVTMRIEGSALVGEDIEDIEHALSLVERLSDTFIEPQPVERVEAAPVTVSIQGVDDVLVATDIRASRKVRRPETQQPIQPTPPTTTTPTTGQAAGATTGAVLQSTVTTETQPVATGLTASVSEVSTKSATVEPTSGAETIRETTGLRTPEHVIKPLVDAKLIVLGEDGVGKHTLMQKAGFISQAREDPLRDYVYRRVVELADYRVRLNAWCFDDAVKSRVSRKEFYGDTDVIVVMYSAADRWSFESVDFWLKESSTVLRELPPIVIIGNKTDLRSQQDSESGIRPITTEEGFAFAEDVAKKHSVGNVLHPVAFIETSCLVSQGVQEVFRTAAELYVKCRLKR